MAQVQPVQLGLPLPRYLVGVSTKMYFSHAQTISYMQQLASLFPTPISNLGIFFIPSFPSLIPCAGILQSQHQSEEQTTRTIPSIILGAQDCSSLEHPAASTGSVSAVQLSEIGCSIVELGHAERRAAPFKETDDFIAAKVNIASKNGLVPLVCIGERKKSGGVASANVGLAIDQIKDQVLSVLDALLKHEGESAGSEAGQHKGMLDRKVPLVFAYEPVWAIGAAKPAEPDHVVAVVRGIRRLVTDHVKSINMMDTLDLRILYGGSAGPGTWTALKDDLDGLFLGRFAHDVQNVKLVVEEVLSGAGPVHEN